MKPRLCLIDRCEEHRADDAWTHYVPRRETPVFAHVHMLRVGRAA